MNLLLVLAAAGVVSWALRVCFAAALAPERLPAALRDRLDNVGPAVMAALLVTMLTHGQGLRGLLLPLPELGAVAMAAAVAWRTRSLAATVVGGLTTLALLQHLIA